MSVGDGAEGGLRFRRKADPWMKTEAACLQLNLWMRYVACCICANGQSPSTDPQAFSVRLTPVSHSSWSVLRLPVMCSRSKVKL